MSFKLINISKTFITNKGKKTLDSISFTLKNKDINLIYGKSGSGKTTLLNILAGLDVDFSGEYIFNTLSLKKQTDEKRAELRLTKIGLIYQFFNLLPELSIKENILLPNIILGRSDQYKYNELITYLDIKNIQFQKPVQCSGGELQRASFARALINSPELIIADEPTGNLDSKNTQNVIKLVKKLNKEFQTTFIIATHDDAFKKITPSIFELKDGKLTY
tara:strand:- start:6227 stop:6883 length:657 start_codon:yes stop_codon:yes gene_type:complete